MIKTPKKTINAKICQAGDNFMANLGTIFARSPTASKVEAAVWVSASHGLVLLGSREIEVVVVVARTAGCR